MTDLPSDGRPLAERLAVYRPQPGAGFYERMERAPWNAAPARWTVRTLLLLGLILSLFALLVALVALVDWVGGQGEALPGRPARPAYTVAYDCCLALTLAPYLDRLSGRAAILAVAAPADRQPARRVPPRSPRAIFPRWSPGRSAPALGLAGW